GGKSVAKLDVDAPHGKQPHTDVDADGGKGRGGLLHGSGVDDLLEGTPLKDGKLKTKAKLFDDVLKDFDLLTEKYQHNMLKQIFEKIRIKEEVMVDPVFGQSFSVWNISFFKDKKGGHGLQHIETSKGHVSEAPRNKDIPHETTPPKGGKASGDSGHSQHDEPVTDKKGNDANKNQPYEKEKAGAEGTGDVNLTEPSLPKGGKPKGNYTKGDSHGIKKESETANLMADQGYDIEMLDEVNGGNGYGIKESSNPDFVIEGKVFDCYAPTIETNVDNILRNITKKTKTQAERIVLNLDQFPSEKVTEIIQGILRKANPNGDLKNLKELFIVKDGEITRVFGG
ncbi:hypothetical protein ABEO71_20720, partial [Brevibacillus parabrevis]